MKESSVNRQCMPRVGRSSLFGWSVCSGGAKDAESNGDSD